MDSPDSDPPSPLHSSPASRTRDNTRRTHRTPKEKEKALGSTSKELVRLLVHEEQESQELRNLLQTLTERLKDESQRANNAEQRAKEVAVRFKEANDGRVAALHESARVSEELRLYKLQLENAQREIARAQELLDSVEAQRHEAEEAAARARSMARKLKEEKVVQQARDQGRIEGIKEGMARGRELGYEEGRKEGYARGRAAAAKELAQKGYGQKDAPSLSGSTAFEPGTVPLPPPELPPTPPQEPALPPEPEPVYVHPPVSTTPPGQPPPDIRPVSVFNLQRSPQHVPLDYPPDGWIPVIDEDQRIRLPPPHELSPGPFSPMSSPPHNSRPAMVFSPDQPVLMIPPPDRRDNLSETDSLATPKMMRTQHQIRKRKSNDSTSIASTTLSQFDLIGPPASSSGRSHTTSHRANVLSAIVEEKTPSTAPSSYAPAASPAPVMPIPVTMPTPQAPAPIPLDRGQMSPHEFYTRPGSRSSPESAARITPLQSQSRQTLSPKGSVVSNAGFDISVVPPSRPESGRSNVAYTQDGLLSANDAENGASASAPQTPSSQPAPSQPISLPHNGLPPGFVPMGLPAQSARQSHPDSVPAAPVRTTDTKSPPNVIPPPGPQPGIPAIYRYYSPPSSGTPGQPNTQPSEQPPVIPLPPSGPGGRRYSRSALQRDSTTDSDEDGAPVSSSLSSSSMDSLTTPPAKRIPLASPSYAVAPVPPNVIYPVPPPRSVGSHTSSAARVPLPPSTIASSPQPSVAARVPLPQSSIGSPRSEYTRVPHRARSTAALVQEQTGQSVQSPPPLMVPGGFGA